MSSSNLNKPQKTSKQRKRDEERHGEMREETFTNTGSKRLEERKSSQT